MNQALASIGLTNGEIKIYLALLKLGEATNSPIARLVAMQSSSVYYCLNSLIDKGFVSYIKKGDRKHFIPTNPENILTLIEKKKKEIKKQKKDILTILPELKAQYHAIKEKTLAEVYEGFNGLQTIFNNILQTLNKGDTYEAFVIKQTNDKKLNLLFSRHNKALKAKGIKLNLLAHNNMKSIFKTVYGESFLHKYQEVRYTNDTIPIGITIYRDTVITHTSENNKPTSILVKNSHLAEMYRAHFYFIWNKTKKQ